MRQTTDHPLSSRKPNDGARVEQKNWTVVRTIVGYLEESRCHAGISG
ncbi:hypothetical protein Pd630_LPD05682 [Rhodococcus opacus PD630]|nr:hypothetical protein Pd630_LPD05682 [Rhodococcus opacus PD630]